MVLSYNEGDSSLMGEGVAAGSGRPFSLMVILAAPSAAAGSWRVSSTSSYSRSSSVQSIAFERQVMYYQESIASVNTTKELV